MHHSRPRAIGVRNAGVPGALNRQKRQRPTALQSGWYHGRFGFRPYGFAKEAGEESCFLFFAHRPQNAKKERNLPTMKWTGLNELRESFLEFFVSKGHTRLP